MARLAKKMIISDNLLLLDVVWFSCTHQTGIIVTEDMITNEIKCYIDGTGKNISADEIYDATTILLLGAFFPNESARPLFPDIDFEKGWIRENPEYFL